MWNEVHSRSISQNKANILWSVQVFMFHTSSELGSGTFFGVSFLVTVNFEVSRFFIAGSSWSVVSATLTPTSVKWSMVSTGWSLMVVEKTRLSLVESMSEIMFYLNCKYLWSGWAMELTERWLNSWWNCWAWLKSPQYHRFWNGRRYQPGRSSIQTES